MAASVRIEDEAFSDERYEDLALAAGLVDADHARGKMAKLWRQCTIEQTHKLTRTTVVRVLGERGPDALVAARLGEVDGDFVRIRGTKGRIEWLKKLRDNAKFGSKGGRPKKNPRGFRDPNPGAEENKTPPAPAPAPALKEEGGLSPADLQLELVKAKTNDAIGQVGTRRVGVGPHQPAIDAFHKYFKSAHSGAKPTWDAKHVGMVKQLVAKHSCAEVVRRVQILSESPPKFPPQPWDLATFVANFDKCATAAQDAQQQPLRATRLL